MNAAAASMIPPALAAPAAVASPAGAGGTTHPTTATTHQGPPVLARLARLWADTHLADTNRQLTYERSYLAGELERVTRERDDAQAELEQWRNGNPRLVALINSRRGQ